MAAVSCDTAPVRIRNEGYEDFVARYLEKHGLLVVTSGALAQKFKGYKRLNGSKVAHILRSLGWIRLSITTNTTYSIYVRDEDALERCLL